ncbi:MAG: hypothetical protein HUU37_01520 [Bdellovibrionales bacterium]|nr:hypothetical protein [Bdellovibrionales bacterium]
MARREGGEEESAHRQLSKILPNEFLEVLRLGGEKMQPKPLRKSAKILKEELLAKAEELRRRTKELFEREPLLPTGNIFEVNENSMGRFHIENFGAGISGANGKTPFDLVVRGKGGIFELVLNQVTCNSLFPGMSFSKSHYSKNIHRRTDFLTLERRKEGLFLSATSKSIENYLVWRIEMSQYQLRSSDSLYLVAEGRTLLLKRSALQKAA